MMVAVEQLYLINHVSLLTTISDFVCRKVVWQMTIDNIFKYVFYNGTVGGIVIAQDLKEATIKVEKYVSSKYPYLLIEEKRIIVWQLKDSINNVNDVYEIFNI